MPLRDHFHTPLSKRFPWSSIHGGWPMKMCEYLIPLLPPPYTAAPNVNPGRPFQIDIAAMQDRSRRPSSPRGTSTITYKPTRPSLSININLSENDDYSIEVRDLNEDLRLVAAIELVSPGNKDRPQERTQFASKCRTLLNQGVSVVIVDVVTSRTANLFGELLDLLGEEPREMAPVYAVSCRYSDDCRLDSWIGPVAVGQPLPKLPLWLSETLAIELDLEPSYEETCRVFNI